MQDIKVTIDGKEQKLTAEQMESIGKMLPQNAWGRKQEGETYYCVNMLGEHRSLSERETVCDDKIYAVGNYYPTRHIAEMRSLDWQLNNLLFRYSMQHGGEKITSAKFRYYLRYDFDSKMWCLVKDVFEAVAPGQIYFENFDAAQSAFREVVELFCNEHPEYLEWLRGDKR